METPDDLFKLELTNIDYIVLGLGTLEQYRQGRKWGTLSHDYDSSSASQTEHNQTPKIILPFNNHDHVPGSQDGLDLDQGQHMVCSDLDPDHPSAKNRVTVEEVYFLVISIILKVLMINCAVSHILQLLTFPVKQNLRMMKSVINVLFIVIIPIIKYT